MVITALNTKLMPNQNVTSAPIRPNALDQNQQPQRVSNNPYACPTLGKCVCCYQQGHLSNNFSQIVS